MKKVSDKQRKKNNILSEYKKLHPKQCVICGRTANDFAHLLPKSIYPEWYTEPLNLVIMCRSCHQYHDDNIEFRTLQDKLFNQVCQFDELSARRYYKR